jgi:hypothetical protein
MLVGLTETNPLGSTIKIYHSIYGVPLRSVLQCWSKTDKVWLDADGTMCGCYLMTLVHRQYDYEKMNHSLVHFFRGDEQRYLLAYSYRIPCVTPNIK